MLCQHKLPYQTTAFDWTHLLLCISKDWEGGKNWKKNSSAWYQFFLVPRLYICINVHLYYSSCTPLTAVVVVNSTLKPCRTTLHTACVSFCLSQGCNLKQTETRQSDWIRGLHRVNLIACAGLKENVCVCLGKQWYEWWFRLCSSIGVKADWFALISLVFCHTIRFMCVCEWVQREKREVRKQRRVNIKWEEGLMCEWVLFFLCSQRNRTTYCKAAGVSRYGASHALLMRQSPSRGNLIGRKPWWVGHYAQLYSTC